MNITDQAKKKLDEYYKSLESGGFSLGRIEKKQYNFEFTAADSGNTGKVKVQVYFGKKGVKTVLQGNNETDTYRKINSLINNQTALDFPRKNNEEFDEYIGSDETGKGDIFGPLIVCAFYCAENDKDKLVNAGVKDSKDLSKFQIGEIARYLINEFKDKYSLVIITPEKYNSLYERFKNLNKLLNWAHSKALSNLSAIYPCKNIIVDKFSNEAIKITNGEFSDFNIVQTHKAERYPGVAAASIIARYKFDRWFEEQTKYNLTKGASLETAKNAEKIFDDYGIEALNKVAKLHFKSISRFLH